MTVEAISLNAQHAASRYCNPFDLEDDQERHTTWDRRYITIHGRTERTKNPMLDKISKVVFDSDKKLFDPPNCSTTSKIERNAINIGLAESGSARYNPFDGRSTHPDEQIRYDIWNSACMTTMIANDNGVDFSLPLVRLLRLPCHTNQPGIEGRFHAHAQDTVYYQKEEEWPLYQPSQLKKFRQADRITEEQKEQMERVLFLWEETKTYWQVQRIYGY
jgi:hypothetical protein